MGTPSRPSVQHQGPAGHCVINGKALGWVSCTAYSTAMGVHKSSVGRKRPSGCDIRRATGDTIGGLTLNQCANAAYRESGVRFQVFVANDFATPKFAAHALRAGRGMVLQGYTGALLHTKHQSTNGGVNHAVWVNEVRGGTLDEPKEALVYDPAADGRRAGIAKSPQWWPWYLVKQFGARLHPWGEDDPRILGIGRMYIMLGADTEPHAHYRYGGARTTPFPDHTLANPPAGRRVNVRKRPDRVNADDIVDRLPAGASFIAYQKTHGAKPAGSDSDLWYGDHNGTKWVHVSGLKSIGGAS